MTTTITDRLSWVAFRADWRARYKLASQDIRDVKRVVAHHRAKRREFGMEADDHRRMADSHQSGLWRLRRDANALMQELDAAKELKAKTMAEMAEAATTDQASLAA